MDPHQQLDVVTARSPAPQADITDLLARAHELAHASVPDSTRRAYASDWRAFTTFCEEHGLGALPAKPAAVAAYVAHLEELGRAPATLDRHLVSIRKAHKIENLPDPTADERVRATRRGLRRTVGSAQHGKSPLMADDIRRLLLPLGESLRDRRNRAILLVGFAGGFRRSELRALRVEDLVFSGRGVVITIQRSKTDQLGHGREVSIHRSQLTATCPCAALEIWVEAAGIESGEVFRGVDRHGNVRPGAIAGRSIAKVVKELCAAAGLDPAGYSGHSLRAGHVTQRRAAGEDAATIADTTGHKSIHMVRRYDRAAKRYRTNVTKALGL